MRSVRTSPEMASMNMGSINFGIFPMLDKYSEWKHDWEPEFLGMTRDFIFRNTFADIEYAIKELGQGHGTRILSFGMTRTIRTRVSCGFESESLRGSWRRRWELGFRRRSRTADLAFEADDFLAQQARAVLAASDSDSGLAVESVEGLHPALRRKTLQLYLQSISGTAISRAQVLEVEQLVINWHGQKKLDLSGITVERVNDRLLVTAN